MKKEKEEVGEDKEEVKRRRRKVEAIVCLGEVRGVRGGGKEWR